MADAQDVLNALTNLQYSVESLPSKIQIPATQIKIVTGLSEISEDLGTILAGEFRAGNKLEPGKGFSGMRMAYPAMTYGDDLWNLVGVNNDALQFGVSADDGKLYAGGGAVVLDATGLRIIGSGLTDQTKQLKFIVDEGGTEYKTGTILGDYGSSDNAAMWIITRVTATTPWNSTYTIMMALDDVNATEGRLYLSSTGYARMYVSSSDVPIVCELALNALSGGGPATASLTAPIVALNGTSLIRMETPVTIVEVADSPDTPTSGYGVLYVKTDGNLYFKNDGGTEYKLTPVPST